MDTTTNIALEYHVQTRNSVAYKYMRNEHFVHYRDDIKKVTHERSVERRGREVKLPMAAALRDVSFNQAMVGRASRRDFAGTLTARELASILYYAVGIKAVESPLGGTRYNHFAASSGGMNSVDLFPIVLDVEGIDPGIYHYDVRRHVLTLVRPGDFRTWLDHELFYQTEWSRAGVVLAMTSSLGRLARKYGPRAYRLSLFDTGLVAQNIYLTASALQLKACASAGFIDDVLDEALQVDGYDVASFLTVMVGK